MHKVMHWLMCILCTSLEGIFFPIGTLALSLGLQFNISNWIPLINYQVLGYIIRHKLLSGFGLLPIISSEIIRV
jgi:hypothetical protein